MNTAIKTLFAISLATFTAFASAAESVNVANLHAQRTELAGQQVTITGEVIKVNEGILRRNFIHVRDDSATEQFDRVIFTSQESAQVGDTVTATGTVKLDTDFGMGYFYPTLVEESTFVPAK